MRICNGASRAWCPQVFAPLARLLGLYSIKEELEALSFKHSQPRAHQVGLGAVRHDSAYTAGRACRRLHSSSLRAECEQWAWSASSF